MFVRPEFKTPIGLKEDPVNIGVPPIGSLYHFISDESLHPVALKLPEPPKQIETPVVIGAQTTEFIIMLSVGIELNEFKLVVVIT